MPYTPLFYSDLPAKAFQRWHKIRLNNDGLRHNKTIESFSSSHSSKLRCMLLESWDVLFLSLKVRIPSGSEYCIEPREYRKINFNQHHLEIVYFLFIKLLIHFKFFLWSQFISFGYSGSGWERNDIQSKSKKFPISGQIGFQNPDPVHHRIAEMSTDQDWIGLDQDWSQVWPDQDWIGLQFIWKLADQDWIGLRKFLFWCEYSENIKNFIFTGLLNGSVYFAIKCKNSAGIILQFELHPPLFT